MKKRIRLWFLTVLAYLYDHEWCARLGWVFSVLNYWSAKSGYSAAVKEMRKNVANDLRCMVRIAYPEMFGKPILYSYQGIFHEAWDAGYARAITLYQLAIDPDIDAASLRPLRDPTFCPQLDSIIQSCLHGMLQPPPTKLYNEYSLGIDKPQSDLQAALWEEYRRYAANIQQIAARFSELYRETNREIPVFVEEPTENEE